MTELLELAEGLARKCHADQKNKVGAPYIGHPRAVAALLAREPEELQAAAWLHDVMEDCHWTTDDLVAAGVPPPVASIVEVLTRRAEESYDAFIERVAEDRAATRVKIADLLHNMDPTRGHDAPLARRVRYHRALIRLLTGRRVPVQATFTCSICGKEAGHYELLPAGAASRRTQNTHLDSPWIYCDNSVRSGDTPVSANKYDWWADVLAERDLHEMRAKDWRHTVFWCEACDQVYCSDHWTIKDVDDDPMCSEFGRCPQGHGQILDE